MINGSLSKLIWIIGGGRLLFEEDLGGMGLLLEMNTRSHSAFTGGIPGACLERMAQDIC